MNSFTFITRIRSIFSKATQKQDLNMVKEYQPIAAAPILTPATDKPQSVIPAQTTLVPVYPPTTAQVLPKAIRPELPAVDDNSLENSGLNSCASSEGDLEVLKAKITIFMSNYLIEVSLQEEDAKAEFTQQVEQTNYKIIHLNSIITNIQNELIPEQLEIIAEYKQKMQELEQKAEQNHGILPQSYSVMQMANLNAKEAIGRLKQKMQLDKSNIQKQEYHINSLNKKIVEMNFHNPDVLNRRMNIFFNGWVMGLQGLNWAETEIAAHKNIFLENQQELRQKIEEKKQVVMLN